MREVVVTGVMFSITGYLLGSILFAKLFTEHIKKIDLTAVSKDGNPGTANAFMNAGFLCGMLSLIGDIGKGIFPVYGYLRVVSGQREFQKYISLMLIFVMIAPVLGHAYSVFYHFEGGKCIAVSFGVLLGLVPDLGPVLVLAFFYILFSAFRIQPHGRRTFAAFVSACVVDAVVLQGKEIVVAMWIITWIVIHKHSLYEKQQLNREQPCHN